MTDEPHVPRRSTLRWLDAPPMPSDELLGRLRAELATVPELAEAWLVRQLQTPEGGESREQLSLALRFAGDEPEPATTVEWIAQLSGQPAVRELGVRSWVFVNDGIREKTERSGVKVYERAAAG